MLKIIDSYLNRITMYRLTLYMLISFVAATFILGFFNKVQYSSFDIIISAAIAVIFCYIANKIFAAFFHATTNIGSVFITSLILTLIIPAKFPHDIPFIAFAGVAAMASKYLLTIEKHHIFNPAAWAVTSIALISSEHSAVWWIGTPYMVPVVLIGGLLIIRKIRRETMITTFFAVYFLLMCVATLFHTGIGGIVNTIEQSCLHSALFFFAFIMLTEPLTSPTTEKKQMYYASLVALLDATPQLRLFGLIFTPEQALILGNVFSYIVNPQYRFVLPLLQKLQLTPDTFAFIFSVPKHFAFVPGQYMEWTLPHQKTDSRGNRRYFSLASAPSENSAMLMVKVPSQSSSFKKALVDLQVGKSIIATSLAGDFVMPKNIRRPMAFIAGGVGIAPFRSMIKQIINKNMQVNIVILYANRTPQDIAFADLLKEAEQYGVKTVNILTDESSVPPNWQGKVGHITAEMIQEIIPDWKKRTFYISGPQPMVKANEELLKHMGAKNVIVDYFPGYVV